MKKAEHYSGSITVAGTSHIHIPILCIEILFDSIDLESERHSFHTMTKSKVSVLWWIVALLFTLAIAAFQRMTGPTYPVSGRMEVDGKKIEYRLLTSSDSDAPAKVTVTGDVQGLGGYVKFRKYRTDDAFTTAELTNDGKTLYAELPPQPPAGKLEYSVMLRSSGKDLPVNEKPVVIRFKGRVPAPVLIPHVILMFCAMLCSTRTGIEALRKGPQLKILTLVTLISLGIGGMILGPVVQKFAFGAYWTGWPFGQDLTDNKTLVAFAAWTVAWLMIRKSDNNRKWIVAAALILLAVYLIPHSMFGSELDHTTGKIETGK